MDPVLIRRLRLFRILTVAGPWLVLGVFVVLRQAGVEAVAGARFDDAERATVTRFWLWCGALAVMSRVAVRVASSVSVRAWVALANYVLATWVALSGAAAWARGAPFAMVVLTYVWALAVVFALFPGRGRED